MVGELTRRSVTQPRSTSVSSVASGGQASRTGVIGFVPSPADMCSHEFR